MRILILFLCALIGLVKSQGRAQYRHDPSGPSVRPYVDTNSKGKPTGAGVEVRIPF